MASNDTRAAETADAERQEKQRKVSEINYNNIRPIIQTCQVARIWHETRPFAV